MIYFLYIDLPTSNGSLFIRNKNARYLYCYYLNKNCIFCYINPNKIHKSQSLFYLTTALHVSDAIVTHLQKHKTTVTIASGNRYTVLFSAAIVEEFQLFHDSSRQQYGVTVTRCCSYSCFVLLKMGDVTPETCRAVVRLNSVTCASSWNYILEYYYDARTHEHKKK